MYLYLYYSCVLDQESTWVDGAAYYVDATSTSSCYVHTYHIIMSTADCYSLYLINDIQINHVISSLCT